MALGKRRSDHQELWVATTSLPSSPGHPFYDALNALLGETDFDRKVEAMCEPHYAKVGRPSIPPGVYFRMLFVGYFEGISSQRGIAWRCQDSLSIRAFLGLAVDARSPDHSSLTVIRKRLPMEVYDEVFTLVLSLAASKGLLSGKLVGVDSTMIEANAAMKTIVRRDTKEDWKTYVRGLAEEEGVEIEDDEDLRRFDKGRKGKKVSNKDWESPTDPDAKIAKMKDGRTHLAYKVEHAIDLEHEIALSAAVHPADRGDADTLPDALLRAQGNVFATGSSQLVEGLAADKGYHKAESLAEVEAFGLGTRTYVCVPDSPSRRRWRDKPRAWKAATIRNRQRLRGSRNREYQRLRSERVERSFAHSCESGASRRSWLRGIVNVSKRYVAHVAAMNLGTILRKLIGVGTPKEMADLRAALAAFFASLTALMNLPPSRTRALIEFEPIDTRPIGGDAAFALGAA